MFCGFLVGEMFMYSVAAIIAAGGSGSRMGMGDKLLCKIGGQTVLKRTLDVFEACEIINAVILVKSPSAVYNTAKYKKIIRVVHGGETRQQSVYNGLLAADGYDFVAVHDAARALVTDEVITATVLKAFETGAAVTGYNVIDTVKTVDAEKIITGTPDRSMLFAAATPQVFRRELLLKAYRRNISSATDDASLVEGICAVSAVVGDRENIKITTPFDLIMAEAILKKRKDDANESRDRS